MRLSDFILHNMESILQGWEDFARSIGPVTGVMDVVDLRDHARDMLETIAADLAEGQTEEESIDKSWGLAPRGRGETAAETHAEHRLRAGITIEQLISEYRALRASVLLLWSKKNKDAPRLEVRDSPGSTRRSIRRWPSP